MVGLDFVRVFRNLSITKEFFWVLEKYWPQELCLSWKNLGSKNFLGWKKGFWSWKSYLNSGKIWVLEIFCPERSWGLKNSCLKKKILAFYSAHVFFQRVVEYFTKFSVLFGPKLRLWLGSKLNDFRLGFCFYEVKFFIFVDNRKLGGGRYDF